MNSQINFQDFFKNQYLDVEFTNNLSVGDILAVLTLSLLLGLFIFFIYKKTFKGVLYTQSFNISLVMVTLVTALIILTISSNLILSLGMVGALSIVRFRTALKDPIDIVFMFWAIAVGVANGAAFFSISIIGSIFIAATLLVMTKYKTINSPFLLVINYNTDDESYFETYLQELKNTIKFSGIKSKIQNNDMVELTIEIRLNDKTMTKLNQLNDKDFIKKTSLISYSGDYVS